MNKKEYNKQYYLENKEKMREYNKQYYLKNKERLREYNKKYNDKNKNRIKEQQKEYHKKNRDIRNNKSKIYYYTPKGNLRAKLHNIKERCYNKKRKDYRFYGGNGIKVCAEWLNSFEKFYLWAINNGYKKGLEIDRINSGKDYSPENCRFVTRYQNIINRRTKGYYYMKDRKKWIVKMSTGDKNKIFRKQFDTETEAKNIVLKLKKERYYKIFGKYKEA